MTVGNPKGYQQAWNELATRYGTTAHGRRPLDGLRRALESLRDAGCVRAYIDGSFVTAKDERGDFDACWEAANIDSRLLIPSYSTSPIGVEAEGEVRRRAVPRRTTG